MTNGDELLEQELELLGSLAPNTVFEADGRWKDPAGFRRSDGSSLTDGELQFLEPLTADEALGPFICRCNFVHHYQPDSHTLVTELLALTESTWAEHPGKRLLDVLALLPEADRARAIEVAEALTAMGLF
jgi:hypothetical protein